MKYFWFFLITNIFCSTNIDKRIPFIDANHYLNQNDQHLSIKISDSLKRNLLPIPIWMLKNIQNEFKNHSSFTSEELDNHFLQSSDALVQYRIRDKKLSFRFNTDVIPLGIHDYIILIYSLINTFRDLADGDFLLDASDKVKINTSKYPILCYAKNIASNYITIPDRFTISKKREKIMREIDNLNNQMGIGSKIKKAFWVGSYKEKIINDNDKTTNDIREKLVKFSLDHPDLLWARFKNYKDLGHVPDDIKHFDHIRFLRNKPYHIAFQFLYLLDDSSISGCLHKCQEVLKTISIPIKLQGENIQWYFSGLKPFVHYIPCKADCSDLGQAIDWLKKNEEQAFSIAYQGSFFCSYYLDKITSYLYIYHVLNKYNELNIDIKKCDF